MVSISGVEIKFGRIIALVIGVVGLVVLYKNFGQGNNADAGVIIQNPASNALQKDGNNDNKDTDSQLADPSKDETKAGTQLAAPVKLADLTLKTLTDVTEIEENKLTKQITYLEVEPTVPDVNKPVILLLHGAIFSADTWNEIGTLSKLKEWGYKAYALNLYYSDNDKVLVNNEEKGVLIQRVVEKLSLSSVIIISPSQSGTYSIPYIMEENNRAKVAGFIPIAPVIDKFYTEAQFQELKIPTLVVRGENDEGLGKAGLTKLKSIPGSTEEVIAGADHDCYKDNPAEWERILHDFLISLSKTST